LAQGGKLLVRRAQIGSVASDEERLAEFDQLVKRRPRDYGEDGEPLGPYGFAGGKVPPALMGAEGVPYGRQETIRQKLQSVHDGVDDDDDDDEFDGDDDDDADGGGDEALLTSYLASADGTGPKDVQSKFDSFLQDVQDHPLLQYSPIPDMARLLRERGKVGEDFSKIAKGSVKEKISAAADLAHRVYELGAAMTGSSRKGRDLLNDIITKTGVASKAGGAAGKLIQMHPDKLFESAMAIGKPSESMRLLNEGLGGAVPGKVKNVVGKVGEKILKGDVGGAISGLFDGSYF